MVNLDDDAWRALPPAAPRVTFGLHPAADVRASGVALDAGGSRFRLDGRFGRGGGVAAAARRLQRGQCARRRGHARSALGQPLDRGRAHGSPQSPQVPGRMERITRDALHRAARLRPHARRARACARHAAAAHARAADRGLRLRRRSRPRQAAAHGPDRRARAPISPIATSDNPRTEDPERHHRRHRAGNGRRAAPPDRGPPGRDPRALAEARAGDTILLAGKGHETYQVLGTEKVPFDEREIVRAATGGRA